MSTHDPTRTPRVLRKIQPAVLPPVRPPPRSLAVEASPIDETAAQPPPDVDRHSSVPPMVAGPSAHGVETSTRSASTQKAVLYGALFGLGLVGMFVLGARFGQQMPVAEHPSTAVAAARAPAHAVVTPPSQPPPPLTEGPVIPAVAVNDLARAPAPPVRRPVQSRPPGAPSASPEPTAASPAASSSSTAAAAAPSAGNSASTADTKDPADDNGSNLVPVIPASSAPPPDPLVKAILQDIDEQKKNQ